MKSTRVVALAIPVLIAVAGCSGNGGGDNAGGDTAAAPGQTTNAATPSGEASGPATGNGSNGATPAGVPGADTAKTKVKQCKAGSGGIELEVENTTDKPRTYVIAVRVKGADGKDMGGAAVSTRVEAGKKATGTGEASGKIEGKATCEVSNIGSVEG